MKRLNIKLVAFLISTAVVFVIGVYFLHGFQVERKSDIFKRQAEAAEAKGDRSDALKAYNKYLQQRPKDAQVSLKYALLAAKETEDPKESKSFLRNFRRALEALESTAIEFPELEKHIELRKKAAEYNMMARRFTNARDHLSYIIDEPNHGPDVDVMYANCLIAGDKVQDAVKVLSKLIGFDPVKQTFDAKARGSKEVSAYITLANIYRMKLSLPKTANLILKQALKANPDSPKIHIEYARALATDNKRPEAAAELAEAVRLDPKDYEAVLFSAALARDQKDYDKAKALLEQGIKMHPTRGPMYTELAMTYLVTRDLAGGRKVLDRGLKAAPDDQQLMWTLGLVAVDSQDLDTARKVVRDLRKTDYSQARTDFVQGRILLGEKNFLQATQLFERIRPSLTPWPDLVRQTDQNLMLCYRFQAQGDKLTEIAQRVLADEPQNLLAHLSLAEGLDLVGRKSEALQQYEMLAGTAGGMEAVMKQDYLWKPLLRLRIEAQRKLPPEKQDWTKVNELQALIKQKVSGDPVNEIILEAEVLLRQGKPEDAAKRLEKALTTMPNESRILNALIGANIVAKKYDVARKQMTQLPDTSKKSIQYAMLEGELAVREGGTEAKKKLDAIEAKQGQFKDDEQSQLLLALGQAHKLIGDVPGARRLWKIAAEKQPGNLNIRQNLFELAAASEDLKEMQEIIDQVQKLMGPSSSEANFLRASLLFEQVRIAQRKEYKPGQTRLMLDSDEKAKLVESRRLLDEIQRRRPDWHQIPQLLADIDSLEAKPEEMIDHLKLALKLGPPNSKLVNRLYTMLVTRNRLDEANEALDLLGEREDTKWTQIALDAQRGNVNEALQEAEKAIKKSPNDPNSLLRYGELLSLGKRPREAETQFNKALSIAPDLPDTYLSMIGHYLRNDQKAEATKVLDNAKRKLPEDRRATLVAQGAELLQDIPQAEEAYNTLLAEKPDNLSTLRALAAFYLRQQNVDQARKHLVTLIGRAEKNPNERTNLMWARRAMAEVLAQSKDYREFQKIRPLLEKNALDGQLDPEDQLMLAKIYASRNEPQSRRDALKLYEQVATKTQLTTPDLGNMARLYEQSGDWPKCRETLLKILAGKRVVPNTYQVIAEKSTEHGEYNEAIRWADALNKAQPNSIAPIFIAARIEGKMGHTDKAKERLMKLMPPTKPENTVLIRTIAQRFDEMGLDADAEKVFRTLATLAPQNKLDLAEYVANHGKFEEGLKICGDLLPTALATPAQPANAAPGAPSQPAGPTAGEILTSAVEIIHAGGDKVTPAQLAMVDKWFAEVAAKAPNPTQLEILRAEFLDLTSRGPDQEQALRALLASDDKTLGDLDRAVLKNNLAYGLAMRKVELDEALKLMNESIEILGPRGDLLDSRGAVYLAMGNNQAALADFKDAALEVTAQKLFHLAQAQAATGDTKSAKASLERAIKNEHLKQKDLHPTEWKLLPSLKTSLGIK